MTTTSRATHLTPADLDTVRAASSRRDLAEASAASARRVAKAAHDAYAAEELAARSAENARAAEFNRILIIYNLGVDGKFDLLTGAVTRAVEPEPEDAATTHTATMTNPGGPQ